MRLAMRKAKAYNKSTCPKAHLLSLISAYTHAQSVHAQSSLYMHSLISACCVLLVPKTKATDMYVHIFKTLLQLVLLHFIAICPKTIYSLPLKMFLLILFFSENGSTGLIEIFMITSMKGRRSLAVLTQQLVGSHTLYHTV